MLLHKPLKIKRPSPIRLTRSSRRKRAFGLIFWIFNCRRCRCYGMCDVAVEQEKREQPYSDGFPNMAVFFCCTPVWQLPCVSIVSILSYWKLPERTSFLLVGENGFVTKASPLQSEKGDCRHDAFAKSPRLCLGSAAQTSAFAQ